MRTRPRDPRLQRHGNERHETVTAYGSAARAALAEASRDVRRRPRADAAPRAQAQFSAPGGRAGRRLADQIAEETASRLRAPGTDDGSWDGNQVPERRTIAVRAGLRVERRRDGAIAIVPTTQAGAKGLERAMQPERRRAESTANRDANGAFHFRGDDPLGITHALNAATAAMAVNAARAACGADRPRTTNETPSASSGPSTSQQPAPSAPGAAAKTRRPCAKFAR